MKKLKAIALSISIVCGIFFPNFVKSDVKSDSCKTCESFANQQCTSENLTNKLKCMKNICRLKPACHECEFCADVECKLCKGDIDLCSSNCINYPGCQPFYQCLKGWINPEKQYPGCESAFGCLKGWLQCKDDCKKQVCKISINCINCAACK